ncbi:molybdopterin molybdotransferase MoeA [Streptomyces stramineus]
MSAEPPHVPALERKAAPQLPAYDFLLADFADGAPTSSQPASACRETPEEPGPGPGPAPAPPGYDFLFAGSSAADVSPERAAPRQEAGPPGGTPAADPAPQPPRHAATPWPGACGAASGAGERLPAVVRSLDGALGHVLAAPLAALTDLPSFDTSAMDGWAVAGPGPWRLPRDGGGVLAGDEHTETSPVRDGHAVRIATGARVPPGVTGVVRSEHGEVTEQGELYATRHVTHGQDIRPRGQECRRGDLLVPEGTPVTPALLGLAAAAGYDELSVTRRPRVDVLVLGDELLREGLPHGGRIRDALGPMLGPWLSALGTEVIAVRRLGDDADALYAALTASDADVVITTGGTAAGPVDHVHPTLRRLGAELLVDGVAVRPGHPMLLARLAPGRHLVGLPGNPLAAVSGLLTLAEPLLRTLAGRPAPAPYRAVLTEAVQGHPADTRLVPVVHRHSERAQPLRFHGPAMLRGVAAADALAVIPPGGAPQGAAVDLLELPWAGSA